MQRGKVGWLAVVIVVALLLRGMILETGVTLTPDSHKRYHPLAQNLALGHGFSTDLQPPYRPNNFDQPGYPLLLAGMLHLYPSGRAIVALQLAMELLTVLLAVHMAATLGWSRKTQIGTAVTGLLCPFLPLWSGYMMTEVAATLAGTATCYCWVRALDGHGRRRSGWWLAAGLGSGACLLIRADMAACVALLFGVATGLELRRRAGYGWHGMRRTLVRIGLCGTATLLCLAPWMVRNERVFGAPLPLGSSGAQVSNGYVQWLGTWVDDTSFQKPYWWDVLNSFGPRHFPADKIPNPYERLYAMNALAIARQQQSFEGEPSSRFAVLAQEAWYHRPLVCWLLAPTRRLVATWLHAPDYAPLNALRELRRSPHLNAPTSRQQIAILLLRVIWWSLLALSLIGAVIAMRHAGEQHSRGRIALPLALVAGRSLIPLITAIGVEPRYLMEALPICFLLGGRGMVTILAMAEATRRWYRERKPGFLHTPTALSRRPTLSTRRSHLAQREPDSPI